MKPSDPLNQARVQLLDNDHKYMCINQEHNHVHSQKRKTAAGLVPCCHQADIRMRSHRLLQRDGNNSAASCQQA